MVVLFPSAPAILLQEPLPTNASEWLTRPEFLGPLGFGILLLAVLAVIKWPDYASWRRSRRHEVLRPIDVVQLNTGLAPAIVDVRSEQEFHGPKGHLKGAINIPVANLVRDVGAHVADTRQLVVLVDWNDSLSHVAAGLLEARGYRWVRPLRGGLRAWRALDLPVAVTGGKR